MVPNTKLTLKSFSYALGLTTNKNYQKSNHGCIFVSIDFYLMHLDFRTSSKFSLRNYCAWGKKSV